MGVEPTDIGGGVSVELWQLRDGTYGGLFEDHGCSSGGRSAITFDVPGNDHVPRDAKWTVVSVDPLHIEPSLRCTICGKHGFIREGRWEEA